MADPEHLDIIRQGVEAWNQWRMENYLLVLPDLSNADITKAFLPGANLAAANLSGANLNHTVLSRADLIGADLSNTNLCDAEFIHAYLRDANLTEAWAINADLTEADLRKSILSKANFSNAEFSRAKLSRAKLIETNLTGAKFREANLDEADLYMANIDEADFYMAHLYKTTLKWATNLAKANFSQAFLNFVDFSWAHLEGAQLSGSKLRAANLSNAHLSQVDLRQADLFHANLHRADLRGAILLGTNLLETNLSNACLDGANVYGVSAWNVNLEGASQSDLIITPGKESTVTVDELEVAQFVYLLLKNEKISKVINTIGKKGVLILGRFSDPERKSVLEAMRAELRAQQYVPIVFDFERPTDRDFTETVKTLAGMCLFIIADITSPKSAPLELQATVPDYMIPFVPIIQKDEQPFAMFQNLQKFKWVLPLLKYSSIDSLMDVFNIGIIGPALKKRDELVVEKAQQVITIDADELRKMTRP